MDKLIYTLLVRSNVTNINKNDLHLQLLSHSDYPSIKAVTDTLDYFGIENIAANVPVSALDQMPKTFLALIGAEGISELVIVFKRNKRIIFIDQKGKKHKSNYNDFSEKWTGTLIAIEQEAKQPSSVLKKINGSVLAITVLLALATTVIALDGRTTSAVLYSALALIGMAISFFTSREELGIKDKVTTKVCGAISGDHSGCSNVINSREGKIFGILSLADLSLLFFASVLLHSITFGFNQSIAYALSLATLPVIAYSVFLQSFTIKQFCLLCIATSAVLLSQFVLLQSNYSSWDFTFLNVLEFAFIFGLIAATWLFTKKHWKNSNSLLDTKRDFYKLKRNESLFKLAISNEQILSIDSLDKTYQISFGNEHAPIKISTVTNPLCGFCQEPFQIFDKLLDNHPSLVQVNYIFSTSEDPDNPATKIAKKIAALYLKDKKKSYDALKDWYTNKDMDAWNRKYESVNTIMLESEKILKENRDWCSRSNIHYTPLTLINDFNFPIKQYSLDDIPYFLEVLKSLSTEELEPSSIIN